MTHLVDQGVAYDTLESIKKDLAKTLKTSTRYIELEEV